MPGIGVQAISAQLGFRRERRKTEPLCSPAFSSLAPDSGRGPQQGNRKGSNFSLMWNTEGKPKGEDKGAYGAPEAHELWR